MKICVIQLLALTMFGFLFLMGCTLSFQNISSVGKAQDMVDSAQEPNNDIKPDINVSVPVKPL